MNRADIKRSKRLSLVLRHRPDSIGLTLDDSGWVDVGRLLSALSEHGTRMSRDDLLRVVATNDKQRFELDAPSQRIRARRTRTVRRYIAEGQLDAVRLGRKTLRIKVESVERFIDAKPVGNWR